MLIVHLYIFLYEALVSFSPLFQLGLFVFLLLSRNYLYTNMYAEYFLGSDCRVCLYSNLETQVQSLGWEEPLDKGMATHSNILAWRTPWTEEPSVLQSVGSQKSQTVLK